MIFLILGPIYSLVLTYLHLYFTAGSVSQHPSSLAAQMGMVLLLHGGVMLVGLAMFMVGVFKVTTADYKRDTLTTIIIIAVTVVSVLWAGVFGIIAAIFVTYRLIKSKKIKSDTIS